MKLTELHKDSRGKIILLTEDMSYPEVTVFTTAKGFARGGCIHMWSDEHTCVIEGEVEYVIGGRRLRMKAGESALIPSNTPHYYISLTQSVVLEWGAKPEEKAEKHLEYRAVVDKINQENMRGKI